MGHLCLWSPLKQPGAAETSVQEPDMSKVTLV